MVGATFELAMNTDMVYTFILTNVLQVANIVEVKC